MVHSERLKPYLSSEIPAWVSRVRNRVLGNDNAGSLVATSPGREETEGIEAISDVPGDGAEQADPNSLDGGQTGLVGPTESMEVGTQERKSSKRVLLNRSTKPLEAG